MLGIGLSLAGSTSSTAVLAQVPSLDLDFMTGSLPTTVTFSRASTATYYNSSGTLTSATTNTPRFDHDPVTLAAKGLLIEEARTNVLLRSEEFGTTWTKSGVTVSSNATTDPMGGTAADKLVEDGTNTSHTVLQPFSVTSGTSYTFSIYAKAAEKTIIGLVFGIGFGVTQRARFDLSGAGTATSVQGTNTVAISALSGGWYRCSVTSTASASASTNFVAELLDAGFATTYTGTAGQGVYLFGAMLEAGAFATSYIPTTSATVTRAADVATVGTLTPWFNAAEGTVFVEASRSGTSAFARLAQFDDATNNNVISIISGGAGSNRIYAFIGSGGVTQMDTSAAVNNQTLTVPFKAALAWRVNDSAFCFNGGTVTTDTGVTIPTVTQLRIGGLGAVNSLNGHVRRMRVHQSRLPNDTLQTLTA